TALLTLCYALCVKYAANDVITDARKVLNAAAANEHDRVLLQIVSFARNVARDLKAIRQTNTRNFPQSRVRRLWGCRVDARAHTALLRAFLHRRHFVSLYRRNARLSAQLLYRCHQRFQGQNGEGPARTATRSNEDE